MAAVNWTIQLAYDTDANFATANPTLKVGQLVLVSDDSDTDVDNVLHIRAKVGTGAAYNSTPFANIGNIWPAAASANGKSLVTAANYAAMRTLLGLVIGTNVQAYAPDLAAIAGLSPANDDVIQRKAGAWTNRTIAQLRTDIAALLASNNLSDLGSAATARTNLGLGTAALLSEQYIKPSADFTTSSTSLVDVTGLSFAMAANTKYLVDGVIIATSSATSNGIGVTCNGPASPTALVFEVVAFLTDGTGNNSSCRSNIYQTITLPTTSGSGQNMIAFRALIKNGATAGDFKIQARSETGGGSITILDTSTLKVRTVA